MKEYFETIRYLDGLANIPKDKHFAQNRIERMRYFLRLIGNPHKGNFKIIHIAGTSGKGSVVAMLHNALRMAGKRVGNFSSPFVTTSIEKIRVGDRYISPRELTDIVEYLKPYIDQAYLKSPYGGPSYFEIWFAIAFLYFTQKKCKWVVLETGCGGRYDASNVIEKPVATAITNIDLDHTQLLGNTLQKIAYEKAGIMKRGVPFFTTEQRPHLLKLFEKLARKTGAKFIPVKTSGNYQNDNEALARAILRRLGMPNPRIIKPKLPCRFEIMQKKPLVILDGAHSVSKIKTTLNNLKKLKFKKLILVLAIAANKDIKRICELIAPLADYIFATRFNMPFRKCAHPKDLLMACGKGKMYIDPQQALSAALKKASPGDLILATGSFFLTGELRKKWYPEEKLIRTLRSF